MKCICGKCGSEMKRYNNKSGIEGCGLVCTSMSCSRRRPPGSKGEDVMCVREATNEDFTDPDLMVRVGWVVTWSD